MKRASVFISYAHIDGMEFVRRLAFALEMYMDVYWDRRLQVGDYPDDLRATLASHDHFLLVMTPYALASDWCKGELAQAQTAGKPILLAKVYTGDAALEAQYPCGDFSTDFEAGFRTLTTTMTAQPYSSWESLSGAPINILLNYLKAGAIPCVIAKQVGEWVLVDKLWDAVTSELGAKRAAKLFFTKPQTASGVLTQCKVLLEQFEKARDKRNGDLVKQFIPIVENCIDNLLPLPDNQHIAAGQLAYDISMQTRSLIETKQMSDRDFDQLQRTKTFFDFDVAEKLRVLINDHARRSRPLY